MPGIPGHLADMVHMGGQGFERNILTVIAFFPASLQECTEWDNPDDAVAGDQPLDDFIRKQAVAVVTRQKSRGVGMAGDDRALVQIQGLPC